MTRLAASILAALALVWSAVLGFWAQDRRIPVKSEFAGVVGPVVPGGELLIRWHVIRYRACEATKQELVLDVRGVRWVLPLHVFPSPPGPMGADTYISQTPIPMNIPDGPATLRVSISYACNPIQRIFPVYDNIPEIPFLISPPVSSPP